MKCRSIPAFSFSWPDDLSRMVPQAALQVRHTLFKTRHRLSSPTAALHGSILASSVEHTPCRRQECAISRHLDSESHFLPFERDVESHGMTRHRSGLALAGSVLLLLLAAHPAVAQTRVEYGVRFGPAFTSLTSVATFDGTVVAAAPEPALHFGGFVNIGISGPLAFQPEVLIAAKGNRVHDRNATSTTSGTGLIPPQADRVILLRYIEIPLLVRMSRQTRADSSVYLIGGPALAFRRNAVIRQVSDSGKFVDIADRVNGGNLSLVYGGGFQYRRWLVDARFTKGLRNVAVVPLPAAVKTSAFAVLMGVRL